jgi:hypothetical protein
MAQATDARRAVRPPLESVREAPFALVAIPRPMVSPTTA